jgi:hypothetical protein
MNKYTNIIMQRGRDDILINEFSVLRVEFDRKLAYSQIQTYWSLSLSFLIWLLTTIQYFIVQDTFFYVLCIIISCTSFCILLKNIYSTRKKSIELQYSNYITMVTDPTISFGPSNIRTERILIGAPLC